MFRSRAPLPLVAVILDAVKEVRVRIWGAAPLALSPLAGPETWHLAGNRAAIRPNPCGARRHAAHKPAALCCFLVSASEASGYTDPHCGRDRGRAQTPRHGRPPTPLDPNHMGRGARGRNQRTKHGACPS